jgi:hypothetical protein
MRWVWLQQLWGVGCYGGNLWSGLDSGLLRFGDEGASRLDGTVSCCMVMGLLWFV